MNLLPTNFNFFITGRHELKYLRDKDINYFIGYSHTGDSDPYLPENVFEHIGWMEDFYVYEYHDAYSKYHRECGLKMPDKELAYGIVGHARRIEEKLKKGETVNALFGCSAGISRSTATAYCVLCYLLGEWRERDALSLVLSRRSIASPNPLIVKLVDDLLDRKYKMTGILHNHLDLEKQEEDTSVSDNPLLF